MLTADSGFMTSRFLPMQLAQDSQSALAVTRGAYSPPSTMYVERMSKAPSVRQLLQWVAPATHATLCADILGMFLGNADLYALPVVDQRMMPDALIERHAYIEYFSRPYSIELFGNRPVSQIREIAAVLYKKPVVVEADTSIDDVAAIILDAGMQHMVSGFVVTENHEYLGVANGHALLNHITQRKQVELHYLAHYDQLTQIPNRMLMHDRLRIACIEANRNESLVGLLFIDLDRFKQINDTMGHCCGDFLLQAVAARLESCLRGNDTVARLGGDEFAVLLPNLAKASDVEIMAQRVVDCFHLPFNILDHEIFVTASLGTVAYPIDESDANNLLAKADTAMYEAKQSGRNTFRQYTAGLSMHSMDQLSLEADLRQAIVNHELLLYYQPQIDALSGEVVGVEALIRWQHPTRGLLSPAAFMQIAEDSGLIVDIGNWVLREACYQQKAWSLYHTPPLRMAINISTVQFRRNNFIEVVRGAIEETGIDPGSIELELTEHMAMHHADAVLDTLRELKQIGVKLAIDDFGTGFSNLGYLQRFPIDRLKVDQSFVRGIEKIPANKSIVQAIVSLAKSLSLEVIAEGVETAVEYAEVSDCGCDEIQGYFFARPMQARGLSIWLSAKQRKANCGEVA